MTDAADGGWFPGAGGAKLFRRSWGDAGAARGHVLLVHGLGEHAGRYEPVGTFLSGRGFAVHAADMRGHGRSPGRRGHVARLGLLVEDLEALRAAAVPEQTGAPIFVFGHSLGGLVAGRFVLAADPGTLRGVVFSAPFVEAAVRVPGWKRTLGAVADAVAPGLTLDNGLPLEDIFRREADRLAWEADPLVHRRISARTWGEMRRGAAVLRSGASRLDVPALFLLAGDERIVSNEAARDLAARLEPAARIREYEGARHALFHDPQAPAALEDLAGWLDERVEPPAAGEPTRGRTG
ncbi:MAG: alpha/beta hydrolase [Gemmatimonadota bacterium]|nr:alpha/beta hydrolase [Gemmatimonadota bacterium]